MRSSARSTTRPTCGGSRPGGVLEPLVSRAGELAGVARGRGRGACRRDAPERHLERAARRARADRPRPAGRRGRAAVAGRRARARGRPAPLAPWRIRRPPARRGWRRCAWRRRPPARLARGPADPDPPSAAAAEAAPGLGRAPVGIAGRAGPRGASRSREIGARPRRQGPRRADSRPVGAARSSGRRRALDRRAQDEIVRAGPGSAPLSLLLVELEEAERVLASEARSAGDRDLRPVRRRPCARAVRRRDVLACETDSRAWIIARDTGAPARRRSDRGSPALCRPSSPGAALH